MKSPAPRRPPLLVRILVLTAACGLAAATAGAQTNSEVNAGVQFDFPLPGARSLALGGAFVAVADDATAALANPAGLTLLTKPEVSIEGRGWRFVNTIPARGHALGSPTGIGVDNISGVVEDETTDSATGVSFLSFVLPKGRFAVGFYRHEQSRYEAHVQSEGVFLSPGFEDRIEPFRGQMDLDIVNYGGSVAYRFGQGVAIGGGIAISQFSIDSTTDRFVNPPPIFTIPVADRGRYTGLGQAYGPADFSPGNTLSYITEAGEDTKVGANAGILVKPAGAPWTVGASFRLGPKFEYEARNVWGPKGETPGGLNDLETVPFKVPDAYSVGATYRPTDAMLLTAQYDFVRFSQMSDDIQEVFGIDDDLPFGPGVEQQIRSGLRFPDAHELRGGFEYAFVRGDRVVALRIGTAYESDHRMRFEYSNPPCDALGTATTNRCVPRLEVLFQPGDAQVHVMPGVGFVFPKFQIDAAYDYSDLRQTFALSAVVRF